MRTTVTLGNKALADQFPSYQRGLDGVNSHVPGELRVQHRSLVAGGLKGHWWQVRVEPRVEWNFDGGFRPILDVDAFLDLPATRGGRGFRSASGAPADAPFSDGFSLSPRRRMGCFGADGLIFTDSTHDLEVLTRRRPVT